MALVLGTLTGFTQEEQNEFIIKALKGSKTADLVSIQAGIKTTEQLAYLDSSVALQEGANCTWAASGTTNITQKAITVADIKVMEAFCAKDLEPYWTQTLMAAGSHTDNMPDLVSRAIMEAKGKGIAHANELLLWQGDTGSGTANLAHADGFVKLTTTASDEIASNTGGVTVATGITIANIEAIIDAQVAVFPEEILQRDDLFIACSWDSFRKYIAALKNANYFHYVANAEEIRNGSINIPGSNIKLEAVPGLTGVTNMIGSYWDNFVMGTDLDNEEEQAEFTYAVEAKEHRLEYRYKIGMQIKFTEFVTSFVLVP